MALRLSKAFKTTPELWLNLQQNYDLWQASHKSADWKTVEAIAV
jgi:addiction module HigA family antidote